MAIEIETEKIVKQGEQKRKIVAIKALSRDGLPIIYTDGHPHCHLDGKNLWLSSEKLADYVAPGILYSEQRFQDFLGAIQECSERLAKINAELKEANKNWHGKETFII